MMSGANWTHKEAWNGQPYEDRKFNDIPTPRKPDSWPRRLLHVPSMTSIARTGQNTYGDACEPPYHALSYTWGRYATTGPAIKIRNVTWNIPAIHPSHFTVGEFEAAIQAAAADCPFLWLDIACIDQENHFTKIDEIGKQVEIFRRATNVFVWLAPWTTTEIEQVFYLMEQSCQQVPKRDHLKMKKKQTVPLWTLDLSRDALRNLASQPWFTSLWTLQEAHISRYAVIISRSSDAFSRAWTYGEKDLEQPIDLDWIVRISREIFDLWSLHDDPAAVAMCESISESGLLVLSTINKHLLVGASSKRQATLVEDYIYGIMQVYGFKLGIFDSLSELQDSFGQALNAMNPVYAQLFVHGTPSPAGKAWRATQGAILPPACFSASQSHTFCEIGVRPQQVMYFHGRTCALEGLIPLWGMACRQAGKLGFPIYFNTDARPTCSHTFLQLLERATPNTNRKSGWFCQSTRVSYLDELTSFLDYPSSTYKVLYLGTVDLHSTEAGIPRDPERHDVGMVVCQQSYSNRSLWRRVAVCLWIDNPDPPPLDEEDVEDGLFQKDDYVNIRLSIPEGFWKQETLELG